MATNNKGPSKKLLYFLPLLALPVLYLFQEGKKTGHIEQQRTPATSPTQIKNVAQRPAQNYQRPQSQKQVLFNGRRPQSLQHLFEADPQYLLERGHVLAKDVGAVAKKDYNPNMGKVLYEDEVFTFFQTTEGAKHIPVAYYKYTGSFHPISSVLHVTGAGPELRAQLTGEGLQEYYYHSRLKLLSVKSTHQEVLQLYSTLKKRGINVKLEVIKPHLQPI